MQLCFNEQLHVLNGISDNILRLHLIITENSNFYTIKDFNYISESDNICLWQHLT
jgi:hypothetical protein